MLSLSSVFVHSEARPKHQELHTLKAVERYQIQNLVPSYMATLSAVLLFSWVVLPFRKRRKMPYFSIHTDLIILYRSLICKNIF